MVIVGKPSFLNGSKTRDPATHHGKDIVRIRTVDLGGEPKSDGVSVL